MTARFVGGLVGTLIFITAANEIQSDPLSLKGIIVAIVAGVIGNVLGGWLVRKWQEAGRE